MPDGASNTDTANSLMAAGKAFARFNTRKPGYENERSVQIGKEVVSLSFIEPFTMTDAVSTTYGWAIPYSSKHPEKAMQLLNMLYTNPELANIMCNGVENEHWVYTDENKTNIKYPDGKTSANVGYGRVTYVQPNQQITIPWDGDPVDIWDQMDEFNRTAHASPAKGFVYDNSNVLNEVTACMNVKNKYWNGLLCGSMDPSVAIPEMNTELEANGIDRIIAEKQRQLDAVSYTHLRDRHVAYEWDQDGRLLRMLGKYGCPSDTGVNDTVRDTRLIFYTEKRLGEPFNQPTRIVRAPNGDLYASDGYANTAVHHFSQEGKLLNSWGGLGTEPGKFGIVHSVWADRLGRVWIADREFDRVQDVYKRQAGVWPPISRVYSWRLREYTGCGGGD